MTALVVIYLLTQFWSMVVIVGLSFFGILWALYTTWRVFRALWREGQQLWRRRKLRGGSGQGPY